MNSRYLRYLRVLALGIACWDTMGAVHAQPFLDACFTSPTVGTSFANTANVSNQNSDLLRWTGSAWVGYWPMANVTIPPPGSVVNSRAIWSGDGTVWTSGGEGFGLRLASPVVTGTTYTFAFQRVSHGFGQNGTFAPILYTNTGGTFGTSYGAIPGVGTAWTNSNITFTATAGSSGHTFVYFHNNVGSGMFLGCNTVILPMAFSNLQAFPTGQSVHLQWRIQDEPNYAWHVVERSINGVDFSEVGREPSVHAGPEGHDYQFLDGNVAANAAQRRYYRIRSIDMEGLEAFSPVVETSLTRENGLWVQVQNPIAAGSDVQARFFTSKAGTAAYQISDLQGRIVSEGSLEAQEGYNLARLSTNELSAGIYSLTLRCGTNTGNCRLVVQ